ncbi:MAG: DUF1080 domain-containing protein [Planctomycetota bacterium]
MQNIFSRSLFATIAVTLFAAASQSRAEADEGVEPFDGNWALVMPDGAAGWLTLTVEGPSVTGELWTVGGGKRLSSFKVIGDRLLFSRSVRIGPPEYPGGPPTGARVACPHVATVDGDMISLSVTYPRPGTEGEAATFGGTRLPPLPPKPDLSVVVFGEPIELFNGRDLSGWRLTEAEKINGWKAVDGLLVNDTPKTTFEPYSRYGNLRTDREFTDFNLTLDFMVPPGGNSGVYLRGLYEAQVLDRDSRMQGIQGVGAIFGRIAPRENAGRPGGVWQSYDITLVDRHATVVLNGVKVVDNEPIAGCTNGALWADETRPGPIYLQGDHTEVRYRNLVLREVLRAE